MCHRRSGPQRAGGSRWYGTYYGMPCPQHPGYFPILHPLFCPLLLLCLPAPSSQHSFNWPHSLTFPERPQGDIVIFSKYGLSRCLPCLICTLLENKVLDCMLVVPLSLQCGKNNSFHFPSWLGLYGFAWCLNA